MKKHNFENHYLIDNAYNCDHLSDFFTTTGQTLRKVNDQVVEAAHHKVKMFFESRPNYNHQNKETLSSGEATLAGIIHFNSINI